jgi:hypothetical protein
MERQSLKLFKTTCNSTSVEELKVEGDISMDRYRYEVGHGLTTNNRKFRNVVKICVSKSAYIFFAESLSVLMSISIASDEI